MTFLLAALSFLKRVPWQAYAGIAALAALWWLYSAGFDNGLAQGRAELAAAVEAYEDAQAEAERLALAAKAEQEARYRELAERTDDEHARNQAAAADATDRYIAGNRVPTCTPASSPGQSPGTGEDHSAGLPAPVPADVIMGEADVRTCAALYTYAADAHNWANDLGE